MKKVIVAVLLGMLLVCNVSFAKDPGWIRKGKLKIGMSGAEVAHILFWSAPWDHKRNPTSSGCISEYYKESKQEILIPPSKDIYYVFEDVTLPSIVGEECDVGNGTLQAYTYSHADALALIENKNNVQTSVSRKLSKSEKKQREKEVAQKEQEDNKFAKIEEYKKTCSAIGFELGTDKFADCTLKLYVADNKETTQIVQSSSGAQEIIIRDPDRERRIGTKAFSDFVNGKCQINLLSKNPCQF